MSKRSVLQSKTELKENKDSSYTLWLAESETN